MTFLNPAALWGLFFILIPIIIHLFNFRKVKKLYFSNVSFLKSVQNKSSSNNTLRKLLILLLRVLAIVFLILAFAQPVMDSGSESDLITSEVYYLDNSLSMGRYAASNNDLLSDAMSMIESNVAGRGDNYRFGFLTNEITKYNRPILSKELTDKLSEIDLSTKSQGLINILAKMNRIDPNAGRFVILSDFQKHAFERLSNVLEDTSRTFLLIKLNALPVSNLYIDSVAMDNPIGLPNENILRIGVSNVGESLRKEVLLKVFKDGNQISSFSRNFEPNAMTWVEIDLSEINNLSGNYEVEVADNEFIYDNSFRFVIEKFSKPRIFQIFENKANSYLSSVYANKDFFDLRVSSINNVDQDQLKNADLIILDHLKSIPDWLAYQLLDFPNSIVIFPDQSIILESYQSFLGGKVVVATDTIKQNLSNASLKHPLFTSVFNQLADQADLPWFKTKYSFGTVSDIVLKSSANQSILVKNRSNTYFFTNPLNDDYTNLHKKGLFVPLMYKLSLNHRQSSIAAYGIEDAFVPLDNDSSYFDGNLKLVSDELVIVPLLRNINGNLSLELPSAMDQPGFYQLINSRDTIKTLAFNLAKQESDLRSISEEEINQMINGANHVQLEEIDDAIAISEKMASINQKQPLWKYALLLTLVFLIAELTLLRVFR